MTKVVTVTWTFNLKQVTNIALLQWKARGTMIEHPLGPPPNGCHALGMAPRPMTLAWTLVMAGQGSRRWYHVRDQVWGDNLGSGNVAIRLYASIWSTTYLQEWRKNMFVSSTCPWLRWGRAPALNGKKKRWNSHWTPSFGNTCGGRKGGEPIASDAGTLRLILKKPLWWALTN